MTLTVGDGNSEVCACRERFASITKLRSARARARLFAWTSSPTNRSSFFMVCLLCVGSFMGDAAPAGAPAPAALHSLSRAIRDSATPTSTPLFLSENAALTRRAAIKSRRFARLPRNRSLFIFTPCTHTALKLLCPRMASSLCATFLFVAASRSRSLSFLSQRLLHRVPATRFGAPRSRFSLPPNPWRRLTGGRSGDCPRYSHLGLVGSRRLYALGVHPCAA